MDRFERIEEWVAQCTDALGPCVRAGGSECDIAILDNFPDPGRAIFLTQGLAHYGLQGFPAGPLAFELAMVIQGRSPSWGAVQWLDALVAQVVESFMAVGRTPARDTPYAVADWPRVHAASPPGLHSLFFTYAFFLPASACQWRDEELGDLLFLEVVPLTASEASLMAKSQAEFRSAVDSGGIDLLAHDRLIEQT